MRSKKETQAILRRMTFLRRLLKENGLILSSYDPGVGALRKIGRNPFTKQWSTVSLDFGRTEWAWLEPLLLELRKLRRTSTTTKAP